MCEFNDGGTSLSTPVRAYILQINNEVAEPIHLYSLVREADLSNEQCLQPVIPRELEEPLLRIDSDKPIQQYINGQQPQVHTALQIPNKSNISNNFDTSSSTSKNINTSQDWSIYQTKKFSEKNLSSHFLHIPDSVAVPRAEAVLPDILLLRKNVVYSRRTLPPRVRFGPVQGIMNKLFPAECDELIFIAAVNITPIFLLRRDDESVIHCDVSDKDKANWLSLLPLGTESTANVWLYEEGNQLYGITVRPVPTRTPLSIGYSKKYADTHSLPPGNPVIDLDEALSKEPKEWWCECWSSFPSAGSLQRHKDSFHTDRSELKYRCIYCTQTFSRRSSLKRHVIMFCQKRKEKITNTNTENSPPVKEKQSDNISNNDESRAPSDESFQLYSQGIDFNTLFDTDRMPILDLSGSSKSDLDFNPYKFESLDNLDVNIPAQPQVESKPQEDEFDSCIRCGESVSKLKRYRHAKTCPALRFECECGQIFNNKKKLAQHIFLKHLHGNQKPPTEVTEGKYECEGCQRTFKRRGMLVNHLWRAHNMPYAAVPLERTVKRYPCPACPKTYTTAAKRKIHVNNHHPETKSYHAITIEGENRKCEPASCHLCPRQYSTRAKLFQHIRTSHPREHLPKRSSKRY